jgi:hypothetical protein
MTDTLTRDRLAWIETLESGRFDQGHGALLTQVTEGYYDDELDEYIETVPERETPSYCCIGVARKVADPMWLDGFTGEDWDENDDYEYVVVRLDISDKLKYHLIAMNDGDMVQADERRVLRSMRAPGRDFEFIARFLRKVWGLTDVQR